MRVVVLSETVAADERRRRVGLGEAATSSGCYRLRLRMRLRITYDAHQWPCHPPDKVCISRAARAQKHEVQRQRLSHIEAPVSASMSRCTTHEAAGRLG